jgi:hypothetical protein
MNRQDLFEHHQLLTDRAFEIMQAKNNDYAGSKGDVPFANFQRCEAMGVCTTEQGFLVRIIDKVSRLSTFAQDGKLLVKNEGYEDAILDIINYCVLMSAYIKGKSEKTLTDSNTS